MGHLSPDEENSCKRLQIASRLLSAGFNQTNTESENVTNNRRLRLIDSFISAADALSPRIKSQISIRDTTLANSLIMRATCRLKIWQSDGMVKRWNERILALAKIQESEQQQGTPPELIAMLDTADPILKEALESLSDIRRAIPLKPDDIEQTLLIRRTNLAFAMMAQTFLLLRPMTLCSETRLRHVIGEQATLLEMQEKLLQSSLSPLSKMLESVNTDGWNRQLGPVLKDTKMVCFDLAAFAINITLPKPDANITSEEIEQARTRIDSSLHGCSVMSQLIGELIECYSAVGTEKAFEALRVSSDLRTGDFVSVLAPSGLHVPAQIQEDGSATVSTAGGLNYKQVDGDFQLAEEIDSDTETATETASADTPSKPQSSKLTKAVNKAQLLLTPDLQGQMARHLTTCKGLNNPDLVMPAYRLQAEKWQKQAERMTTMASRLDRFNTVSNASDEEQLQLTDLAARLREQATDLTFRAQELTRPETRWSLIKAYARPQASQLAELLEAGQISQVHKPTKLITDPPGMLFEVKIQPSPDADGTVHPPVWLHLHSKKSMPLKAVRKGHAQHFEAVHLKSDTEKNRGANWIDAERASGRYDAAVHRSPVDDELLQRLRRFGNW
ncbi:MAG: hypothetical protein ACI8WM_001392 [Burkholderiaceae bacterium]|jgi:hypothetical protein